MITAEIMLHKCWYHDRLCECDTLTGQQYNAMRCTEYGCDRLRIEIDHDGAVRCFLSGGRPTDLEKLEADCETYDEYGAIFDAIDRIDTMDDETYSGVDEFEPTPCESCRAEATLNSV